jgi:hypothetical protein
MVEVFQHPESVPLWIEAGRGKPDWDAIFKDYNSMVDYPGAYYWRELATHYPDAKVLHTERDPDKWFDSTQATIFSPNSPVDRAEGPMAEFFGSFTREIREHMHDRAFMTEHFRRHNAMVKATIPSERLLVYQTGEGWERLCAFLGVPVPDQPYPSENSTAEFVGRMQQSRGDVSEMARDAKAE